VIVDGRTIAAPPGSSVLDAARSVGIDIPALRHHPALPAAGACRLCMVEVQGGGVQPACLLPARDDLRVITDSERLRAARRVSLSLPCWVGAGPGRSIDEGNPLIRGRTSRS
jgi:NADH dehydrogenase/NADH:ubiquinone oxidoreductase subunit G